MFKHVQTALQTKKKLMLKCFGNINMEQNTDEGYRKSLRTRIAYLHNLHQINEQNTQIREKLESRTQYTKNAQDLRKGPFQPSSC